ncbi:hypothetical protein C5B42_05885 [Candidatus Cerribacteria bacterium 'Amazon FNV 2010 28 9']|uniref:M23ase beta-sheet core domain-containing protein n=1 Tax=Candidatus Cerribacteria bacterium 'Amazon FNV 2010 28 9' TaxID=2081795 RepID=A0A317JPN3_9BACT|nr:MAG: hypothetical protein C5B42_05885 [Candidatus Cerribacteria bacterium 'Amazon FNV 2010 28 9']
MIQINKHLLSLAMGISLVATVPTVAFADQPLRIDPTLEISASESAQLQKLFPLMGLDPKSDQGDAVVNVLVTPLPTATPVSTPVPSPTSEPDSRSVVEPVFQTLSTNTQQVLPLPPEDVIGISTYFSRFHPGVDLRAKIGTPVLSTLPGEVIEIGYEAAGYGKYIVVAHQFNGVIYKSLYAHLRAVLVKVGEQVNADTQIGEVGLTGHTTGPHLHFEIHKEDTPIDPLAFFMANKIALAK